MDIPPVFSRAEIVQTLAVDHNVSLEAINSSNTGVSWICFVTASKMLPTRAKQRQWRLSRQSVDSDVRLEGESQFVPQRLRQNSLKHTRAHKLSSKQQVVEKTQKSQKYKWRSRRSPLIVATRHFQQQHVPQSVSESMQEHLDADLQSESQRKYIAALPSIYATLPTRYVTVPVRCETAYVASGSILTSPLPDSSSAKQERRFRNAMRARGGRVRSNEEMMRFCSHNRALVRRNFAIPSSDAELASAGACRVKQHSAGRSLSEVTNHNVFTCDPGQVLRILRADTRGLAATTPPALGNMNPYGGEGPTCHPCDHCWESAEYSIVSEGDVVFDKEYMQVQMDDVDHLDANVDVQESTIEDETSEERTVAKCGKLADDDLWHAQADAFRDWLRTNKDKPPNQRAKKGSVEKQLALWWKNQPRQVNTESRRLIYEELLHRTGRKPKLATSIPPPTRNDSTPVSRKRADAACVRSVRREMQTALAGDNVAPSVAVSASRSSTVSTQAKTKEKQESLSSKCLARTCKGTQCRRNRTRGSEFCAQHQKDATDGCLRHGRVDNELAAKSTPPARAAKQKKCVWYCRATMWTKAAYFGVNDLSELSPEQYATCLSQVHEHFRRNAAHRSGWKLETGMGPTTVDERANLLKANYNGDARVFKYYSRQVFLDQLARVNDGLALTPENATERQFMVALAETSLQMQRCHCVRASKFQVFEYRGPQCYPQLRDEARYRANEPKASR